MGWRESYQKQYDAKSDLIPQQGDGDRPKALDELSVSEIRDFVASHTRIQGVKAGLNPEARRGTREDQSAKKLDGQISVIRSNFNKVHRMYQKEGRDNHYLEMMVLHQKLLPLEEESIALQTAKVLSLRTERAQQSDRPTRKEDQKVWDDKLGLLNRDIASNVKKLGLHAEDQYKRLSALGLDIDNDQQVLGSFNVQPAAAPQP